MAENYLQQLAEQYKDSVGKSLSKYDILKDLDIFVLDNSIRESTVGQLKGHTLEAKWQVYDEVKKCGFKHTIVAAFNHMTRVDDVFVDQLFERGEDRDGLWAFSEVTEGMKNKVPDFENVPVGLRKMKELGLYNVIFEIDLGDATYDFSKFSTEEYCNLVSKWVTWCYDNLGSDSKILVNFRDIPDAIATDANRVFQTVDFLCKLSEPKHLFGLIFEEPRGKSLPEEVATWAKFFRQIMKDNHWNGHLLVHVHEKFGYGDATALEALMHGANGIWASVCMEGAAMGNASSCVTLINLVRLGNKKVLDKFNCTYLRKAAINVTKITTGEEPHIKQPIYGGRALDFVLDLNKDEFDLASFFGEEAPIRITSLASPEMIQSHLVRQFGENMQFTKELAYKMKELILKDLRNNRKEEYMSKTGIAILFDRAGGKLTEDMCNSLARDVLEKPHAKNLIAVIRKRWDTWDLQEHEQGDDRLQFDSFYNGFMSPYFSCYRCNDTQKALMAIDMDADGYVDWNEFMVYLKWAIHQYPDTPTADELLDIAFRKGIIPAMRDEILAKQG